MLVGLDFDNTITRCTRPTHDAGPGAAEPSPGVKDFLAACHVAGVRVVIVGPWAAPPDAAHAFLTAYGFYETGVTGLTPESVYLEPTGPAALDRIGHLGCDVYVSGRPAFLAEPAFPVRPWRILFAPDEDHPDPEDTIRAVSWTEVATVVFGAPPGRKAA
jgi:hypothetical protein